LFNAFLEKRCPYFSAESVRILQRNCNIRTRSQTVKTLLNFNVVSLDKYASLAKLVDSQWEGNMLIKNSMLKLDMLNLNVRTTQHHNRELVTQRKHKVSDITHF
jgi:hypothetical protein